MTDRYFVGVDVGTSSVRAALVSAEGLLVTTATNPIKIWEPQPDFYEQSSEDIWNAVCSCVKSVTKDVDKSQVKGIGFDATCSMVVLDKAGEPLSVSPTGEQCWNVIMWMDHRAAEQADRINKDKHDILKFVGGKVYLEMQTPKLLWLKENLRTQCWDKAGHFFDLPDFLTYKSTGQESRSLCSLVCKWTYRSGPDGQGWDESYLRGVGLEELVGGGSIGREVLPPGEPLPGGLTPRAAEQLGLSPGTAVGTSIIDAHAGGLGTLGCHPIDAELRDVPLSSRLSLICGTSTCHMTVTEDPLFVPGVWGPAYSALVPGMWMLEGGQSATGKLVDHVVETHPAYNWVKDDADKRNAHVFTVLNQILEFSASRSGAGDVSDDVTRLTRNLHVWPDYHGNRSPLSNPNLKGMVSGLTLSTGAEDLALQYLATVQALAYGTRHILEVMRAAGHDVTMLVACGGLSHNKLFVQTHADVTGLPVVIPDVTESVLLGAAMLGARASGEFQSLKDSMANMSGKGEVLKPNKNVTSYHVKKYEVFRKMHELQEEATRIMTDC